MLRLGPTGRGITRLRLGFSLRLWLSRGIHDVLVIVPAVGVLSVLGSGLGHEVIVPVPVDLTLQAPPPSILHGRARPSRGKHRGDLPPFPPKLPVSLQNDGVLLGRPRVPPHIRIDVVDPALPASSGLPAGETDGDELPLSAHALKFKIPTSPLLLLGPSRGEHVLADQAGQGPILLLGPITDGRSRRCFSSVLSGRGGVVGGISSGAVILFGVPVVSHTPTTAPVLRPYVRTAPMPCKL
mmetsp:Transcript_44266/g.134825  ORF Transcript_44266/g.134825 Transcript_44266/m.134825 type:complete len:240 (-) Transcript_44266:60-779(-)